MAQASAASDEKMTELLKSLSLEAANETKVKGALLRPELRKDEENLELFLRNEVKLSEEQVARVMAAARDPETGPKQEQGEKSEEEKKIAAEPVVVTDVRSYRASLQATAGARPTKDLSAYEDLDAKL